ncbi:MAG: RNA polymerase sigma factor [Bacteroidota bacterium]
MQEIDLKKLYRQWPKIRSELKNLGCSRSNAEDIFQEAILILCRKNEESDFRLETDAFFFVKSTSKFLWYNQARKEQKQATFELTGDVIQIDEDWLEKEERLNLIENTIANLGKQCREILTFFYGKNLSMDEIAKKTGLRNDKVVKAQKYRCIQKVKDMLRVENEE